MFEAIKYKSRIKKAFSDCFDPLRSVMGNVPIPMKTDRYITGAILGSCRGYAEVMNIDASTYAAIVDAVFEEIFRQDSLTVQTQTETWLTEADDQFMESYYHAKEKASSEIDLSWLQQYATEHFDVAFEVYHST